MTLIELTTQINSDITRCFDLSRDVDIHKLSAVGTKERAIDGRTHGLCERGDTITWEATHFGIRQRLRVEITKLDRPHFFEDRMITGAFKSMRHEHHFKFENGVTFMIDKFEYEVPYGLAGNIFNRLILKRYMTKFLMTRNAIIKRLAEGT